MGEGERTNVVKAYQLNFGCVTFSSLEWLDGMPLVFNMPIIERPDSTAVEVELSDGSKVTPVCVILAPADEDNERDTLLLLGENFGDGQRDTVRPVRINIVGDLFLQGPNGKVNAKGLSYENEEDMNYVTSTVRLVYAKMWSIKELPESQRYLQWPLPSSIYPNSCESLFSSTTHVIRLAFSGGITLDGVTSIEPGMKNIFKVSTDEDEELEYLGLGDLGNTVEGKEGKNYLQDGDNYVDICLDSSMLGNKLEKNLKVKILCDEETTSVLYPPKGFPYGCKPQTVVLSDQNSYGSFLKVWIEEKNMNNFCRVN